MNTSFKKITQYFDGFVIPLLREKHNKIISKMSIMILGSVGLGIDDELSDLEAGIYLDDSYWKEYGRDIQLSLNLLLRKNNPWQEKGSILCVHPTSWLLDGQAKKFLTDNANLPWEEISFEKLFTMQNNLIYFDPQGMLKQLRDMTSIDNYPKDLWRKSLIIWLKNVTEELHEFKDSVLRNEVLEAAACFGRIIEAIIQLGFIIMHRYYPWRSHLSWAFSKLLTSEEIKYVVYKAIHTDNLQEKLDCVETIFLNYKHYITSKNLLPEIDVYPESLYDELLWAERLEAWKNPKWRDYITNCKKRALDAGESEKDFWVFSLWN